VRKRHVAGKVISADKGLCMSEQTIRTNTKLKFLTAETSQEIWIQICFCICSYN